MPTNAKGADQLVDPILQDGEIVAEPESMVEWRKIGGANDGRDWG